MYRLSERQRRRSLAQECCLDLFPPGSGRLWCFGMGSINTEYWKHMEWYGKHMEWLMISCDSIDDSVELSENHLVSFQRSFPKASASSQGKAHVHIWSHHSNSEVGNVDQHKLVFSSGRQVVSIGKWPFLPVISPTHAGFVACNLQLPQLWLGALSGAPKNPHFQCRHQLFDFGSRLDSWGFAVERSLNLSL